MRQNKKADFLPSQNVSNKWFLGGKSFLGFKYPPLPPSSAALQMKKKLLQE